MPRTIHRVAHEGRQVAVRKHVPRETCRTHCSKCHQPYGKREEGRTHGYCAECHAAYMRNWRKRERLKRKHERHVAFLDGYRAGMCEARDDS
jgi:hypothetical protein